MRPRLTLFTGGVKPAILFSGSAIEGATVGTEVGSASVNGVKGTPTYSLSDDASGKYAINSTGVVTVADALTAGIDTITIHVTGTTPALADASFSIFVSAAYPTLLLRDSTSIFLLRDGTSALVLRN